MPGAFIDDSGPEIPHQAASHPGSAYEAWLAGAGLGSNSSSALPLTKPVDPSAVPLTQPVDPYYGSDSYQMGAYTMGAPTMGAYAMDSPPTVGSWRARRAATQRASRTGQALQT